MLQGKLDEQIVAQVESRGDVALAVVKSDEHAVPCNSFNDNRFSLERKQFEIAEGDTSVSRLREKERNINWFEVGEHGLTLGRLWCKFSSGGTKDEHCSVYED